MTMASKERRCGSSPGKMSSPCPQQIAISISVTRLVMRFATIQTSLYPDLTGRSSPHSYASQMAEEASSSAPFAVKIAVL